MNFYDVERVLDLSQNDPVRIMYLRSVLHRLHGKDYLAGLISLANLYSLEKKFGDAVRFYEKAGMKDEARKARARSLH